MFVGTLPEIIPVFPLDNALLLPRSRLPMQIFEPRYLAMLDDVLKTDHRLIGLVQPSDTADPPNLRSIGCAGRLTSFSEREDGKYIIGLKGISRFRIGAEIDGFCPYRKFEMLWGDYSSDLGKAESDPTLDRDALLPLLEKYFETNDLKTDWSRLGSASDEMLINSLSMMSPFSPIDKQALLEVRDLKSRRELLVTLLEYAIKGGADPEFIQ